MRNFSKLFITLLLMALPAISVSAQDNEKEQEQQSKVWTLEECLQYGLKNHPKVIMADSDVKSREASLMSAKAGFDFSLSGGANWRRSKDERSQGKDGEFITSGHSSDSRGESLSLSKPLFDNKKSLRVKQSREGLNAAKKDRETTLISLASNIKTMYFRALQAQYMLQVKLETLDGYEKHLKKVESFVEVGTHAPFDITKAQVNVANARVDLISAKSNLKQALVNVGNAIGIGGPVHIASLELQELPEFTGKEKRELLKVALERPEVKSSEASLKSAKLGLRESKSSHIPTLSASSGYSWNGDMSPQTHGWNVGVSMSWSLFDGRNTKASVKSAKASVDRSKASLDNLKLNIDKEVESSLNDIIDAAQRYKANEILVQQASESLDLAEGRYDAGLGSPLEITDARVDYEKAKGNLVNAYFDCLIAMTTLDSTLGHMPKEYNAETSIVAKDDSEEAEAETEDLSVRIEPMAAEDSEKIDLEFENKSEK